MSDLTIRGAQENQPWTVPYAAAIDEAAETTIPHILGSHVALHAAKTVGKIASVFEELDHSRTIGVSGTSESITQAQIETLRAMSADLLTTALRIANLYSFDLSNALEERVKEKNGISISGQTG